MKKQLYVFFLLFLSLSVFVSCKHPENPDPANESELPGALKGAFSISATQKVVFAQGNLQYQASTGLWRFADQQYQMLGESNTHISATYNGWIDLFGFATSGWDNGNTYYHPYDIATCGCNSCGYEYGPTDADHHYDLDLVGDYANADWGVYNAISNGGNKAGLWRCLTKEELQYLITQRPNAQEYCYHASVDTIHGVVLLPDDWVRPTDIDASNHQYTIEQWNKMEKAGAVFLPEAGMRHEQEVWVFNKSGYYWTSTAIGGFTPDAAYALSISHANGVVSYYGRPTRYYGCSVRLVHEMP